MYHKQLYYNMHNIHCIYIYIYIDNGHTIVEINTI